MKVPSACFLLLALSVGCRCAQSAPCKAGNPRSFSLFVLTSISGGQHCPSTELAVAWPSIDTTQREDCTYTFSGLNHRYVFPVTFAQVNYRTRSGTTRPYVTLKATSRDKSSEASGDNSYRVFTPSGWQDRYHNDTLTGFLASWSYAGLPALDTTGPVGLSSSVPGNYSASAAGPSSFKLLSKDTGCTFTYRIVSGSFAGLKPTSCKPGSSSDCPASSSCGPGKFRQKQQEAASTYVCALCAAGTYSSSGNSTSCLPCKAGTAAAAAGSASCQACAAPLVPSYKGRTACVLGCDDEEDQYNLRNIGQTLILKNREPCEQAACPHGTVASPNNECLAAQNGNLCVAVSDTGSTTCKSNAQSSAANKDIKTAGLGGAVLQLDSADTSAAVCSTGVKQMAAWLGGKQTWLGFNYTQWGATDHFSAMYHSPIYGLQWTELGSLKGSNLVPYPRCGNAMGGPGPQKSFTTGLGTVLDSTAYVFQTLLSSPPPSGSANTDPKAFRVIFEKGSRADQITTTWFRDGSIGKCPSVTSLVARDTAGRDLATGTCRLTFKVVSGSILGAAAASSSTPCSTGTYAVKHAGGATSCMACPPGYAVASDGKGCSQCTGNSYTSTWGSVKCLACQQPTPDNSYCYSGDNE